jgi:hypothetical protein
MAHAYRTRRTGKSGICGHGRVVALRVSDPFEIDLVMFLPPLTGRSAVGIDVEGTPPLEEDRMTP